MHPRLCACTPHQHLPYGGLHNRAPHSPLRSRPSRGQAADGLQCSARNSTARAGHTLVHVLGHHGVRRVPGDGGGGFCEEIRDSVLHRGGHGARVWQAVGRVRVCVGVVQKPNQGLQNEEGAVWGGGGRGWIERDIA